MSLSLFSRKAGVFVAAVTASLALGSAARADAALLVNAGSVQFGPPAVAMEVGLDFRVFVRPSNPANLRQQWNRESAGGGRFRYRNPATNACLIVPQVAKAGDDLKVGACGGVALRNQWTRQELVPGNGASMLVSAHSGLSFMPNFFAFPGDLLKLETISSVSGVGPFGEYLGT
ncbi:MAG: hypothetical protein ABWZ03_05335 [Solirubrobacterales bacterium]